MASTSKSRIPPPHSASSTNDSIWAPETSASGQQTPNSPSLRSAGPGSAAGSWYDSVLGEEPEGGAGGRGENIRVVVRLRPLTESERIKEDTVGNTTSAIQWQEEDEQTIQITAPDGRIRPLTFHRVHNPLAAQHDIFETCGVKDLVVQALNGYAATVFAFGQTGSGKTFTITGPDVTSTTPQNRPIYTTEQPLPETAGIIPRSLRYLYDQLSRLPADSGIKYTVRASYLEIYNEQVQDLLNRRGTGLNVRWDQERGFFVENLFVVECEVLDDCLAVLEEGLRNRTTAAHAMNEHSSRSHSVMTVYVDADSTAEDGSVTRRNGKISFVDLAGSEKVKESKTSGETFGEALSINKSLLTLGICISALATPHRKHAHIPFRDSKLTRLLADSLGGSGLALMIACISPTTVCLSETLKTLHYANRAKRIRNRPMVRLGNAGGAGGEGVNNLRRELMAVKLENARLRELLITTQSTSAGRERVHSAPGPMISSRITLPPVTSSSSSGSDSRASIAESNDGLKAEISELAAAKRRSERAFAALAREHEALRWQVSSSRLGSGAATPLTASIQSDSPWSASSGSTSEDDWWGQQTARASDASSSERSLIAGGGRGRRLNSLGSGSADKASERNAPTTQKIQPPSAVSSKNSPIPPTTRNRNSFNRASRQSSSHFAAQTMSPTSPISPTSAGKIPPPLSRRPTNPIMQPIPQPIPQQQMQQQYGSPMPYTHNPYYQGMVPMMAPQQVMVAPQQVAAVSNNNKANLREKLLRDVQSLDQQINNLKR
ncbi:hypothetical protein SmJEL517_g01872 [Synchytrium microbalum]|uniref:Kinesin-like protein n=1 Tax=Synchytrium microbalum TaxID=1806994 RepID=A0A507CCL2_9FUNG|nr:uncharacterized protein SmJEL517_g01872 [Synchytrium microbalum]TPX35776.1 hypothetical protein SmJEL517_g01872 [Synchytrium microbalum]